MESTINKYQEKQYVVDWNKVKTLEDIKTVLAGLQFTIHIYSIEHEEQFTALFDAGLLIEKPI